MYKLCYIYNLLQMDYLQILLRKKFRDNVVFAHDIIVHEAT